MSQKLAVDGFKWKKITSKLNEIAFNEKFIKINGEDSDIRHNFKVDVEYSKRLHNLHNDLPFTISSRKNEN